ncbi:MAG: HAD family hydrolase [Clostridiales bacterium]|nr:HAD family hydrolase [Clostridiales bacterium]
MKETGKQAVIFDLDGTLSDSLDSITISANQAIGAFGFAPYDRERYKYFVGDGADELLRRCLKNGGDEKLQYFDRVKEEYKKIFEEYCMYRVKPYEGIREVLEELKARGIKIAVLSNKPHPRTLDVIHALFGEGYFDCVQGQTPEIERKPSPEGVFAISRYFHIPVEDMLYVGDTSTDMKTGKRAGAFTIGVLWGFREREELEENQADAIIAHPSEIIQYL